MPKMHQNTFGGRAQSGPDGGFFVLPQTRLHNGGPSSKGVGEGREGEGRIGREREFLPKVKVIKINTGS